MMQIFGFVFFAIPLKSSLEKLLLSEFINLEEKEKTWKEKVP